MKTLSYETSKRLKEFLGESAPEPMDNNWYEIYEEPLSTSVRMGYKQFASRDYTVAVCPAYTLEDLLSRPFCEAMSKRIGGTNHPVILDARPSVYQGELSFQYWKGGFPAVESELNLLMEASK